MSYTLGAAIAVASAIAFDVYVLRTRLVLGVVFWATYPIVLLFQLLANGILTGRGVVLYDPERILGPRIFSAPVEDLLFGFALVLFTLSLWVWLGPRVGPRKPAR
jgi:lycopene cyclase domain-containing protein